MPLVWCLRNSYTFDPKLEGARPFRPPVACATQEVCQSLSIAALGKLEASRPVTQGASSGGGLIGLLQSLAAPLQEAGEAHPGFCGQAEEVSHRAGHRGVQGA